MVCVWNHAPAHPSATTVTSQLYRAPAISTTYVNSTNGLSRTAPSRRFLTFPVQLTQIVVVLMWQKITHVHITVLRSPRSQPRQVRKNILSNVQKEYRFFNWLYIRNNFCIVLYWYDPVGRHVN
jgi:hypothetical protein